MIKIIRTATVPLSLNVLLKGQLKFLSQYFEVKCIASEEKQLYEVEEREGVRVFAVDMERGISPLKDIISLIKLFLILRKEKPAIVHSITPKAGLLTMLSAKMAGVEIRIHTFTGLIFPSKTGVLQKLLINMDRLLCSAATHIYPEGVGVKNDLINYRITKKPLKIIANGNVNGIDVEYFSRSQVDEKTCLSLKQELNIADDTFVFIFVGRLVGDKGIYELINAFKQVENSSFNSDKSNYKLLLIGPFESNLDPLPSETLYEIQNNENIIALGFIKDIRPYLAIADLLVFPSYREGFPNVVMQAGAMDLPSIVTDINGSNEIIINGINGLIVPSKNIDLLRDAMIKMLKDHSYYNTLKANCRKLIVERYEQRFVWESLLEEYKTLLKSRGLQ